MTFFSRNISNSKPSSGRSYVEIQPRNDKEIDNKKNNHQPHQFPERFLTLRTLGRIGVLFISMLPLASKIDLDATILVIVSVLEFEVIRRESNLSSTNREGEKIIIWAVGFGVSKVLPNEVINDIPLTDSGATPSRAGVV